MKTLQRMLVAISLTCALSSSAAAQDEALPNEPPNDVPVVGAVQTFTVEAGFGAPAMIAAPLVSAPMLGFSMSDSEDYSFMHDPSVRKDLEFVDKQYEKFVELSRAHQEKMQKLMPELMAHNADPERRLEIQNQWKDTQNKFQESVGELLLPHQRDRYKQVARQMRMQMVGMGNAMQHGVLAKELGITKDQKEKLQKIQQDLHKQLQESNLKLRAEAKEKSLQVLTIKQRSQIEELIGDEFKQNQDDWREELEKARRLPALNRPPLAKPESNDG